MMNPIHSPSSTATLANIENVTGGTAADVVTFSAGTTSGTTIDLGSGTDTIVLATATNTLGMANDELLKGSSAADTLVLTSLLSGATIDVDGRAKDIQVLNGLGLGLDEQAVMAIQRWKFKPGERDGVPVAVQAQIEVNFRLM